MIPVYLLCVSLFITSVIKVTDVFISADKSLKETQSIFIEKTRKLHEKNNERGSISLMGALFTFMLSALLMFFAFKFRVELKEARYRKDSYLCFNYLNIQTENYIKDMAKFNIALRALHIAYLADPVATKAVLEATKIARNGRHIYYVKNLIQNPYCKGKTDSLSYLKNLPFKTNLGLVLETNFDSTTILRAPSWTNIHYKDPTGIRLKNSFSLKASFQAEGAFFPNLKVETEEMSMPDFSKLKWPSGFP